MDIGSGGGCVWKWDLCQGGDVPPHYHTSAFYATHNSQAHNQQGAHSQTLTLVNYAIKPSSKHQHSPLPTALNYLWYRAPVVQLDGRKGHLPLGNLIWLLRTVYIDRVVSATILKCPWVSQFDEVWNFRKLQTLKNICWLWTKWTTTIWIKLQERLPTIVDSWHQLVSVKWKEVTLPRI